MSAARILPREEWYRLPGDIAALFETLRPEDIRVVVVEDAGEIVARMALMRIALMEDAWVSPEKSGNPGVVRALLREVANQAHDWTEHWLMAQAPTENGSRQFLERLGAWHPVHTFIVSRERIGMEAVCRPQS